MLKYGAALELHAPPRVLETRTALSVLLPSPSALFLSSLSPAFPLIENEFWQFRWARLNAMDGMTAGIKNKKARRSSSCEIFLRSDARQNSLLFRKEDFM